MNALKKIKPEFNTVNFLLLLLGVSLSTLLLGYAISGIFLGAFVVFAVRYHYKFKNKIKFSIPLLVPILLYFLCLLSYFWSVEKDQTLKGIQRMIVLILVPLAFMLLPNISKKKLSSVLKYFTISNAFLGGVFIISSLAVFLETKDVSAFTYHNLVSIFELNAIYVSVIFALSFFYLLSLENTRLWQKGLIVFFLIFLFLLSSKTIMLVLGLSFIVYFFSRKGSHFNKRRFIIGSLFFSLIMGITAVTVYERFVFEKNSKLSEVWNKEEFGKVYLWTGSSIRLLQARIFKEQIKEESIFLSGFGLFASKENIIKRHLEFNTYPEFHNYNYHNQYIQIFSETGVFGFILLLLMIFFTLRKAYKNNDFFFIMFGITIAFVCITESYLWRQRGLFIFIIFYCLQFKIADSKTKASEYS